MYERSDNPAGNNGTGNQSTDATDPSLTGASAPSEAKTSDWIREAFFSRVGGAPTEPGEPGNEGKQEPDGKTADPKPAESKEAASGVFDTPRPFKAFASEDEYNRSIQAEVDRREAVRARKAKTDRERDLLENHPAEYARVKQEELEEQKRQEALQPIVQTRAAEFATEQVLAYDRHVLDPLVMSLPDSPEKQALLDAAQPTIESRGALFKGALTLYEKQVAAKAVADARKTLAQDPTFVKEILARHGGQYAEPEVVSAVGAAPRGAEESTDAAMNQMLRGRRTTR